jgi:hypothetical protein
LSLEAFIVESFDQPQARRTGNPHDVLPFLVPLEDFIREAIKSFCGPTMLIDLPHD